MDVAGMDVINILGTSAGSLTTIAFVPQVIKTWKSKSGGDISYGMFLLFSLGVVLWLCYGVAISAPPVIISNAVTLCLAVLILVLKFRYDRQGLDT
jgi:MtN3 and saliva related transmembrane protein